MASMSARRTTYAEGWRLYPFSMIGHHAQGALAALAVICLGSTAAIFLAGLWTALYVAYQGLSVLRKSDSPGLDIADYMVGVLIGGGVSFAIPDGIVGTWP